LSSSSKGVGARWRVAVVVACLALGGVVAACGGDDSSGGGGGGDGSSSGKVNMAAELKKPATITVWAWTPGTDKAVAMFEKQYPNIKVKLQNVGQGPPHYRKVRTVLKSGKGLPDVIQMEFQYIPSFTITKSLLDMTPYLPSNFLSAYPEWIQKQIALQGGIYGVPWDSGPLGLIYRKDLLDKAGVKTPINTWDEFATAAVKYHKANPSSYLVDMPGGQSGQWLGLFWQNGSLPFTSDPNSFKVDLTSQKNKEVTDYWDKLYKNGSISHDTDFTSAWYTGFSKGKYAGWISAAWGPIFLQSYTANSKGQWRAQALPQWNAGDKISGNWGGSTLAVLKDSKSPAAATEFARWILTQQAPVEMFSYERFLFPTLTSMLTNPQWLNKKYPFYGGQQVNKVYAQMADSVDKAWQWSPIQEYVNTQGDAIKGKSVDTGAGATAAELGTTAAAATTPVVVASTGTAAVAAGATAGAAGTAGSVASTVGSTVTNLTGSSTVGNIASSLVSGAGELITDLKDVFGPVVTFAQTVLQDVENIDKEYIVPFTTTISKDYSTITGLINEVHTLSQAGNAGSRGVSFAFWGMTPSCFWRAKVCSRNWSQP